MGPSSCKISIIIPVYNAEKSLGRLLTSLLNQDFHKDQYEIIAVDNNSSDNSAAIIRRYGVKYCFESQPSSYKARNKGVMHAMGNKLAFIDSDVIADQNWLSAGIRSMNEFDIAGGEVYPMKSDKKYLYLLDKVVLNHARNLNYQHKSKGISGGNFFCKKAVFDCLGGFDNGSISGADTVFGITAIKRGFSVGNAEGAIVCHPVVSLKKRLKRSYRLTYAFAAKRKVLDRWNENNSNVNLLSKYFDSFRNIANFYWHPIREAYKSGELSGFDCAVVFVLGVLLRLHDLGAIAFSLIFELNKEKMARF